MNSRPTLLIPRLAAGASRTGIRWLSAKPKEYTRWEDHAEKIFVIRHIEKNHVVYSFTPTLSVGFALSFGPFSVIETKNANFASSIRSSNARYPSTARSSSRPPFERTTGTQWL